MSLKFCIIIESNSQKTFFAIVLYTNMAAVTSRENREYICLVSFTKRNSLWKRANDPTLSFFKYPLCTRKFKLNLKYKEFFLHNGNQQYMKKIHCTSVTESKFAKGSYNMIY